jgi:hypothetical protein
MAAYNLVSATGNVGVGRRIWDTGSWDTLAWRDVGDNSVLKAARRLVASNGTLTATGIPATTRRGYPLIASTGPRTLTRIAANLVVRRRLSASAGSTVLAGQDANTGRGFKLFSDAYRFDSLYANENITQANFTGGFAEIDETVANDLDFAWGANNTNSVLEVGLTNPSGNPIGSSLNTVTFRYAKTNNGVVDGSGNAVTVRAWVTDNSAVDIAFDTLLTATGVWQQRSFTFDTSGILNEDNLTIRLTSDASGGTGTTRRGIGISWLKVDVTISNYGIETGEATLSRKYTVTASTGSIIATRNDANLIRTRRMIADKGSRVVTFVDAILKKGYYILSSKGPYILTGIASIGNKGFTAIASAGIVTITRNPANVLRYARITADRGTRVTTGQAAITKKGFFVAADLGPRVFAGINSDLRYGRAARADAGTISLSGRVAITKKGFYVLASRGIYQILGRAASLYRKLFADKGSVSLVGNDADTAARRRIAADTRNFAITGVGNNLARARKVISNTGFCELRYSFAYLRYAGYGFLRPNGNITQSNFTGGFAEIDEITAVDSDFAWSSNNTAATLRVSLSDPAFLPINGAVVVRFRIARTNNGALDGGGNPVTVTASFYEGASLLVTDTTRTATGTWTEYSFSFNASLVTNWANVELRFDNSASGGTGTTRRGAAISWARVELPLVASPDSFGISGESVKFEFGNTPYVVASNGSIQLSGKDASFIRYLLLLANSRAFTVGVNQSILARSRRFDASAGSIAITGIANNFRRGIVMLAAAGTASIAGNQAVTARSRILVASTGARTTTGIPAILKKGFKVFAANSSYSIIGGSALFQRGIRLLASKLSLAVLGQAAVTKKGFRLPSSAGVNIVTGNASNFLRKYVFSASAGAFTVQGNVAQSQGQYAMVGSPGAVLASGNTANFRRSYVVTALPRTFLVSGINQTLAYGRKLVASTNSYITTGRSVDFQKGYTLISAKGILSISLNEFEWIKTRIFTTTSGEININGNISTLSAGYIYPVTGGNISLVGVDARLRYKRRRQKMLLIL